MEPVRVCFAATFFDPGKGGGTLQYCRYFEGLRGRGIVPEVFSGTVKATKIWEADRDAAWRRLPVGAALPAATVYGAPVHGLRLPDAGQHRRTDLFFRGLLARCADPATRPDVVNLMVKPSARASGWLRRLRRLGVPLAYSHTIAPPLPRGRIARSLAAGMLRRFFGRMDAVVVQSGYHEGWLREIGFRGRIELVPNGVDTGHFRPALDEAERRRLRDRLGFPEAAPVVVTVGAVSPRKGTDLMVASMRHVAERLPEARLVVVGWRTDQTDPKLRDFRDRLAALLSDPDLAARVRFTGDVDNVDEYLRAADVHLFASHREGFPNALLEGMASGLPTVTTRFVGWGAELGEPGRDYLLAERDPRSLADAVAGILEEPAVRDRLAAGGLRWVRRSMPVDATVDRLASLYRSLGD